ncbi:hypothetical protein [Flavobacterium ginsenosidimutans]|uniref:hypothetical protein n=1 Tax=Flavobacterium ginsenosidimutans TaxID=687844 RepID=UPI000DAD3461|nr:hypothetical protein [Flavobacterium ginsenosidimutans]KAF2338028.1 hypothetical protein DM444_01225 [Flavobacterium ginsenosidimutans]
MIVQNDLIGTWYNEYYKLVIENNDISLATNIDTEHKQFYTKVIYSEKTTWIESEKTIELSKNITLVKSENVANVILISIQTDRMEIIRLIRLT